MMSGTNFESESGRWFPVSATLLIKFGGQFANEKVDHRVFDNEKGGHCLLQREICLKRLPIGPPLPAAQLA